MLQALESYSASVTDPETGGPLLVTTAFPCVQNSIKIPREIQHARRIGLGVLGLKIEFAFRPVDLPPLKRTDFAHPHATVIGKTRSDLRIIGQRASEREEVFILEKS